jgi:hypothetical protein
MNILGLHIPFTAINDVSKQMPQEADVRRVIQKPQQQVYRIRQDIQKWRNAITSAENVFNPQRYTLYQVYLDIVLDAHLTACIQQRKNLTLSRSYCIKGPDGVKDEDKTELIKTKWFREFLDLSLDSLFWGHSLIQFDDLQDNQFKDIDLVPRIYVKPEKHIVTENYSSMDGLDYLESPYKEWCIGVGKKRDLGLLMKAAPLVLWKKSAIGAWSVYQDAFGMPLAVGKTNTRDEATRINMENALKSLSSGLSMVLDTDDVIEFAESTKSDAHQVFDMLIQRCNSEISKLILGQTATTDEKSFVGSAEVQERVLMQYAELDEYFMEGVLNYQLLPLLNGLGFGFEGCKIDSEEDEDLNILDQLKVDDMLLKYYDIPEDEILETYGRVVTKKTNPVDMGLQDVKNRLNKYYA